MWNEVSDSAFVNEIKEWGFMNNFHDPQGNNRPFIAGKFPLRSKI